MTNTGDRPDDIAVSRADRARSLESLHVVESHAGAAGPSRPDEWRDDLLFALDELATSLHDQFSRSASDDGLLARVAQDAPRLTSAIEELRDRHSGLLEEVDDLRQTLADLTRTVDVAAVRGRIGEMTGELRELRAWETDLVYDAYAFDLGTGD